ncbi:MAG TPA: RlmE family RNA methyltransferase [Myxococcaceae bacterium]|nr:RlmE family RNA methyltransferase [Myxococcaceae bacterium]
MGKPYQRKDHYFRRAKQLGLRARSAFKIEEITDRFSILRPGASVLDLGAAPGGFLQIIARAVGPSGRVLGIDLEPIRALHQPQVKTAVLDVTAEGFIASVRAIEDGEFDAVISDLAPKTSGIRTTDEARSIALALRALEVALARGRAGSSFVAKVFMGGGFAEFCDRVRRAYQRGKIVRPQATRGGSSEVYVVALGKRETAAAAQRAFGAKTGVGDS